MRDNLLAHVGRCDTRLEGVRCVCDMALALHCEYFAKLSRMLPQRFCQRFSCGMLWECCRLLGTLSWNNLWLFACNLLHFVCGYVRIRDTLGVLQDVTQHAYAPSLHAPRAGTRLTVYRAHASLQIAKLSKWLVETEKDFSVDKQLFIAHRWGKSCQKVVRQIGKIFSQK